MVNAMKQGQMDNWRVIYLCRECQSTKINHMYTDKLMERQTALLLGLTSIAPLRNTSVSDLP